MSATLSNRLTLLDTVIAVGRTGLSRNNDAWKDTDARRAIDHAIADGLVRLVGSERNGRDVLTDRGLRLLEEHEREEREACPDCRGACETWTLDGNPCGGEPEDEPA